MDTYEEILYSGQRVNCDNSPVLGVEFVSTRGLYKFE